MDRFGGSVSRGNRGGCRGLEVGRKYRDSRKQLVEDERISDSPPLGIFPGAGFSAWTSDPNHGAVIHGWSGVASPTADGVSTLPTGVDP